MIVCLPVVGMGQTDKQKQLLDKYTLDSADRIFPQIDGAVIYSGIVDLNANKDELFNRAKAWFVSRYNSANDVLQMQDKNDGIIMGKGVFEEYYNMGLMIGNQKVNVFHTVKIYVKDGKYKYEITDLSGKYYYPPSKYMSGGWQVFPIGNIITPGNKKNYRKFLENCDIHVKAIIINLTLSMEKPVTTEW